MFKVGLAPVLPPQSIDALWPRHKKCIQDYIERPTRTASRSISRSSSGPSLDSSLEGYSEHGGDGRTIGGGKFRCGKGKRRGGLYGYYSGAVGLKANDGGGPS